MHIERNYDIIPWCILGFNPLTFYYFLLLQVVDVSHV